MQPVTRLYTQFIPHHYSIHWDLTKAKDRIISGTVTVSGEQKNAQHIRLHTHELIIDKVVVDGKKISDFSLDEAADELIIPHHTPGLVTVEIDFKVALTDAMHGLYPCYFVHDGVRQELYATQFESHHAREAFPCIDEPEAKATFSVSITHDKHHVALSNTPVASSEGRDHAVLTTFDITPKMSSYLVAFVVGKIHKKSGHTKRGIEVNIWASPAQPARTLDFALESATKIIDFYEEYFGVNYPLAKCDHVALPDFSSGAMENWGLITYREVCLLADPRTTGPAGKHLIASVIAHELAHQWFGNLVTMEWWDYLWLNESFADFVEHIAVDALHPEWETWLDFILSRGIAALRRDAIDGVQPVQVTVKHPDEISTLFDGAIVYGKGARLMKMLRAFVGEKAFRAGLKEYFTTFAYGNTTGNDLWACLSKASGKDVGVFMDTWITQPGYPVLSVKQNGLNQTQFFIGEHKPSTKVWPIPLGASPAGDTPEIMHTKELAVEVKSTQRFNSNDNGHFVTQYSPEHLKTLLSGIHTASTIDRLTLLNDQTLLVRGRYESSASLIDLLSYYQNETNDAVWDIIAMTLGELKKFVETDSEAEQKLRALSARIAQSNFERLGFEPLKGESVTDTKLRGTILGMMLYGEDAGAIEGMLARFDIAKLADLPAEIRSLVISTAVRYANDNTVIDQLMDTYQNTPSAELKEDIMAAMTATRDPEVAARLLADCKNAEIVRPQDVSPWFIYLVRNRFTRTVAWDWLRNSWDWVLATYGGDKSFDEFPRYAASGLMTGEQLAEYKAFFEPMLGDPSLTRTITMGISEITARLELLASDGKAVREKLHNLDD
jgi:aminopeptidase N